MTPSQFSTAMLELAVGNLAVALPIGLVAWWLQRRGTQPFLAHLLWLVVLVKLLTPPFYWVRVSVPETATSPAPMLDRTAAVASEGALPEPGWSATLDWPLVLVGIWILGSVVVLLWSLRRAHRFHRLLQTTSVSAPAEIQQNARAIAEGIGLRRAPEVMTTIANVSPMVWWVGGPVRIYIPRTMVETLSHDEAGAILAHEMGHLLRRDHLVRWLEWLVCVSLWWNPLALWARRNLRVCEEICCDLLVLSKTGISRDTYAGAFVSAMALLATGTLRPSGLASQVNGGFIERRVKMILSREFVPETPPWLRGVVLASVALVLPLGFSLAQDNGDLERIEQWLESGVNSAFLTEDQARIMLNALRGSQEKPITRTVQVEHVRATQLVPILRPMMSQTARLSAVAETNSLIITDNPDLVDELLGLIADIDQWSEQAADDAATDQ